ncbi:MAG: ComF family protein [bacterium]
MFSILQQTLNLIYPSNCISCKISLKFYEKYVCDICLNKIEFIKKCCIVCGKPLIASEIKCGQCIVDLPVFEKAISVGNYNVVIKDIILLFKYKKREGISKIIEKIIFKYLENESLNKNIDLMIPVPLHKSRLKERGFNQSEILAKIIRKKYSFKIEKNLIRIKKTRPQIELNAKERKDNIKGAFVLKTPEKIKDKTILLIDDVYTTGSTIKECAKVLQKAKVKTIYVFTFAHG